MSYKLYDAEIEYLYSSGTGQYINTLIPYDSTVVVEGSVKLAGAATGNYMFGIYTIVGGSARRWAVNCATTTSVLAHFGTVTNVSAAFSRNIFHSIRADYRYFSVDGTVTNTKAAAFTPERDVNIYLFARSNNNNADSFRAVYIGDFKIYKGNALVRDYIPVRVGNVGYLFDKVSMKLFGNSGTGSFVLGPDVAPGRYANEIAFLESTGSQWIDTGIKYSNTHEEEVNIVFEFAKINTSDNNIIFGAFDDTSNSCRLFTFVGSDKKWKTSFGEVIPTDTLASVGTKYTVRMYFRNGMQKLTVNGTDIVDATLTTDNIPTEVSQAIFCSNYINNIISPSKIRIESFDISIDGVKVRDFIPVEYNNIGYLYDKVSGKFFANQGTGKFVLGHRAPRFDGKACARSYTRRQLMADTVLPKPYISNGLVFHLDGADATNTTWTDRVAGIVYTLQGASADGKGVTFSGNDNTGRGWGNKSLSAINPNVGTIEVCAWRRSSRGSTWAEILYTTSSIPSIHYVVAKNGTYVGISNRSTAPAPRMPISGKTLGKFTHSCNAARSCYNGTMVEVGINTYDMMQVNYIAGNGTNNNFKGTIYQIRIYNRQLSEAEMKWNQEQDRKRYGIQF